MVAAVSAVLGVAIAVLLAIAASGRFPAGFVHVIEPNPGPRADFLVLTLGGSLLLLAVLAYVGVAQFFARHRSARPSPSLASESIARRAPSPAAIGVRCVDEQRRIGAIGYGHSRRWPSSWRDSSVQPRSL